MDGSSSGSPVTRRANRVPKLEPPNTWKNPQYISVTTQAIPAVTASGHGGASPTSDRKTTAKSKSPATTTRTLTVQANPRPESGCASQSSGTTVSAGASTTSRCRRTGSAIRSGRTGNSIAPRPGDDTSKPSSNPSPLSGFSESPASSVTSEPSTGSKNTGSCCSGWETDSG